MADLVRLAVVAASAHAVFGKDGAREKDFFHVDSATRFWRKAAPADFRELRIGDALRVKTRGVPEAEIDRSGADAAREFAMQIRGANFAAS